MKIAGLQKTSSVDFPGRIAAVVFTAGCNMNCWYCHNRALIDAGRAPERLDPEEVLAFLERRAGLLDGVVVSGGEPTLQRGLEAFIREIRAMGYAIKLDTNGGLPAVLEDLIAKRLLDYVAMDVKAPLEKYRQIAGPNADSEAVARSVDVLLRGEVDYEFRTTMAPTLTRADLRAIGRLVRGAKRHVIQQFRPVDPPAEGLMGEAASLRPLAVETLVEWGEGLAGGVEAMTTRGMGGATFPAAARAAAPAEGRVLFDGAPGWEPSASI